MGALVRVNGGIEKGQWRRWSGSMEALVRVNGGIEKGQWALVRVNGGIEQWGLNGGIEKDQWGALVRANGGIEKGQWGRWSGSMGAWRRVRPDRGLALGQTGVWLWVRQGCGCGSDRRQEVVLQGCKLYLAGL